MTLNERRRHTRRIRAAHAGLGAMTALAATVGSVVVAEAQATVGAPHEIRAKSAADTREITGPTLDEVRAKLARNRVRHVRLVARRSAARARAEKAAANTIPAVWVAVAACESSGHWDDNTGNGFYYGLQFAKSTWDSYRGGLPTVDQYLRAGRSPTPRQQIVVAERVLSTQGHGAWPNCWPS